LAAHLKRCRDALAVRQLDVARSLNTSQSRIAKMEAGDPTVSLDLLVNALVLLGAGKREIARVIADWPNSPRCRRLDAAYWLSRQDW
jgi:predicted transcriptional regulator